MDDRVEVNGFCYGLSTTKTSSCQINISIVIFSRRKHIYIFFLNAFFISVVGLCRNKELTIYFLGFKLFSGGWCTFIVFGFLSVSLVNIKATLRALVTFLSQIWNVFVRQLVYVLVTGRYHVTNCKQLKQLKQLETGW